jgi:HTH-type transcriptional regulator/antitoxin HigA
MDIRSQADYQQALDQFTSWMVHEPADLPPMRALRDAISAYEKGQSYELPAPQTLVGRQEPEMYRRKLNKKNLAALLDIPASRLSDVLQGRRINLDLAQRLYRRLGIPADFILEAA